MSSNEQFETPQGDSWLVKRLKSPRVWVSLVILALAIAFILQNRDPVQINLLTLGVAAPQWITFTILFIAGMVTGRLTGGGGKG